MNFNELNIGDSIYTVNEVLLFKERCIYKNYISKKTIVKIENNFNRIYLFTDDGYSYVVDNEHFETTSFQNISTCINEAKQIVKECYLQLIDTLISQAKKAEDDVKFIKSTIIKYKDYIETL